MKDSASVMSFLDYDTGTNTFPIHAMPSHRENDFERLKDGALPYPAVLDKGERGDV